MGPFYSVLFAFLCCPGLISFLCAILTPTPVGEQLHRFFIFQSRPCTHLTQYWKRVTALFWSIVCAQIFMVLATALCLLPDREEEAIVGAMFALVFSFPLLQFVAVAVSLGLIYLLVHDAPERSAAAELIGRFALWTWIGSMIGVAINFLACAGLMVFTRLSH